MRRGHPRHRTYLAVTAFSATAAGGSFPGGHGARVKLLAYIDRSSSAPATHLLPADQPSALRLLRPPGQADPALDDFRRLPRWRRRAGRRLARARRSRDETGEAYTIGYAFADPSAGPSPAAFAKKHDMAGGSHAGTTRPRSAMLLACQRQAPSSSLPASIRPCDLRRSSPMLLHNLVHEPADTTDFVFLHRSNAYRPTWRDVCPTS